MSTTTKIEMKVSTGGYVAGDRVAVSPERAETLIASGIATRDTTTVPAEVAASVAATEKTEPKRRVRKG